MEIVIHFPTFQTAGKIDVLLLVKWPTFHASISVEQLINPAFLVTSPLPWYIWWLIDIHIHFESYRHDANITYASIELALFYYFFRRVMLNKINHTFSFFIFFQIFSLTQVVQWNFFFNVNDVSFIFFCAPILGKISNNSERYSVSKQIKNFCQVAEL